VTLNNGGSPAVSDGAQAKESGPHIERDTPMTGIYVRVLIVEAVIIIALWFFGRSFS
jgi:hypothetical protein